MTISRRRTKRGPFFSQEQTLLWLTPRKLERWVERETATLTLMKGFIREDSAEVYLIILIFNLFIYLHHCYLLSIIILSLFN